MFKKVVFRTAYTKLPNDELASYAGNIVKRCKGNPAFPMIDTLIPQLDTAQTDFVQAILDARNKAVENVERRESQRLVVLDLLNRIAATLEMNGVDKFQVLDAGMHVPAERQRNTADIPAPFAVKLKLTGNQGEVQVKVVLSTPKDVKYNIVEHSVDGGATWKTGTYDKGAKIVLTELPVLQEVKVRVQSVGTHKRLSAWTAPVAQVVL